MSGLVHATITGETDGISAPVRFLYEPADPHAVTVDFTEHAKTAKEHNGDPIVWTFARCLLIRGLGDGHAGQGDVVVALDGSWLTVTLSSPDGTGTFRFLASAVRKFVARTERAVLVGDESRHMAATIDAAVERLLGRGVR